MGVGWEGTGGKAPQLASTPASCSKQAAQLSPGGCSARFVPACVWALVISDDREGGCRVSCCLLVFGAWDGIALWWVVHKNSVSCTTPPENEVQRRISGVGST